MLSVNVGGDNTDKILGYEQGAIRRALEIIGLLAESYAIKKCPVGDTGRLRGSITHGVDEAEQCAYIGTNVEYAPYVEMGTSKMKAKPYLKPAVNDHVNEYKEIFEDCMRNA